MKASCWVTVCLLCFLTAGIFFLEYLTDDTFIHMQFARNILHGDGISFNPGEPSYGCTSPAWVFLLAASGAVIPKFFFWAKFWAIAAGLLSIYLFYRLSSSVLKDTTYALCATLVWSLNAWFVRWSYSGMETSLAVLFVIASLYCYVRGRTWLLGLLLGVGVLVRPEIGLLLAILIAESLVRRAYGKALRLCLPAVLVLLPWSVFAKIQFGTFFPDTAAAKLGSSFCASELWHGIRRSVSLLALTNGIEIFLLLVSLLLGSSSSFGKRFLRTYPAFLLWMIGLPLFYFLAGYHVISRYLVPVIPIIVIFGFWSLKWIRDRSKRINKNRAWPIGFAGLLILQNLLVLSLVVYPHTHAFTSSVRSGLVGIAEWFRDNTPVESVVAIPDVGVFGYYSERNVLDLAGLVSPEIIPLLAEGDWETVVETMSFADVARPDYLVDRSPDSLRLLRIEKWKEVFIPVFMTSVKSLGINQQETYYYIAYRIDWAEYERIEATISP